MRRLVLLFATAMTLVIQGAAQPADSQPWAVSNISKSDSEQHAKPETGDTPGPLKYLYLDVQFDPNASDRNLNKFRVVDSKGKPVGAYYGAHPAKSQIVFERETPWASLEGLYLEGQGRRVPLFATKPLPVPTTVVGPAPVPSPVIIDQPSSPFIPPQPADVIRVPVTGTAVAPMGTTVVEPANDPVMDRVIEGSTTIIHDDNPTHRVVHDHIHTGGGGGGGGGTGHGHGDGGGTGGGGCPYGDACPICGAGAKDSLEGLDPWAFDEMGQGRYDDLLASIENSASSMNLGAGTRGSGSGTSAGGGLGGGNGSGAGTSRGVGPGAMAGRGAGAGAGVGSGPATGLGGGPLPGMSAAGSGSGSGTGLPGMGPGNSPRTGPGSAAPGQGMGSGAGQGQGAGQGAGSGTGPGAGQGQSPGPGQASGQGQGPAPGDGQGPGPEDGNAAGPEERFAGSGQGAPGQGAAPGAGPGAMAGPAENAPVEPTPNAPVPNENPMNMNNAMNPMESNGSGGGGGGGGGAMAGMGPNMIGPRAVNLAPQPRFRVHNLGPEIDLPNPQGPVIDVYRNTQFYFDPRFRFDPRIRQFGDGYGYGGGGGGGIGYGAGSGDADAAIPGLNDMPELPVLPPETVLYISAGNEGEEGGKIYQVNDAGRVLGIVNLPYQATGLALHRNNGLIAVSPRDRGKIYRLDDSGKLSVIMENNPKLPHPIDVGVAGDSDAIVIADSMADVLAATNIAGTDPVIYERFETARYDDQRMSVAVTRDKHVMFGSDSQSGIYRFFRGEEVQESQSPGPVLPGSGGVAADPKSLKWAATQSPNLIHVYEGGMALRTFKLASGKSIYGQGLLSFAPSGAVVVASRHSDEVDKEVWLTAYETAEGVEGQILSLFPWNRERMLDFVVGPRMLWERHSPSDFESKY